MKFLVFWALLCISFSSWADDLVDFFTILDDETRENISHSISSPQTQLNSQIDALNSENFKIELKKVPASQLGSGHTFEIQPQITNDGKLKILVLGTNESFKDVPAIYELMSKIRPIIDRKFFNNNFEYFEALYNARYGDPESLLNVMKMQLAETQSLLAGNGGYNSLPVPQTELKEYLEGIVIKKLKKDITAQKKKVRAHNKEVKAQRATRRSPLSQLDKDQTKQLKDLVAKNKRAEVASLLKKYLPWEQMPPFEKRFWEISLEAIKNPVHPRDRVLMYRGLDGDAIFDASNGEDKFLLAKLITKNQGTYNRRLRSLEAMYGKWILQNRATKKNEYTRSSRITTMFHNHMIEPKGSPFLSFTPDLDVAASFGSKKLAAFLVDPRVMVANYTTTYIHELEFLAPIATFPDEYIGMVENIGHWVGNSQARQVEEDILGLLKEKLRAKYSASVTNSTLNKIKKHGRYYKYDEGDDFTEAEFRKLRRQVFESLMWGDNANPNDPCLDILVDIGL